MTNPKLATRRLARLPARIRAGDDETPPPRGRIVVHGEHVCGRAVQFTAQLKRLPSYSMVVLCLPGLNRRWRIDCARGAPGIQGGGMAAYLVARPTPAMLGQPWKGAAATALASDAMWTSIPSVENGHWEGCRRRTSGARCVLW